MRKRKSVIAVVAIIAVAAVAALAAGVARGRSHGIVPTGAGSTFVAPLAAR